MTDEKHHSSEPKGYNESEQEAKQRSLKEEVTRWRIPNRQPQDGDYFSREDLAKLQREKQADSDNEFRYHSIREDLIRQRKGTQSDEKVKEKHKSSILNSLLNTSYEEHYDLNELNPIQSYDQFSQLSESENSEKTRDDQEHKVKEETSTENNYVKEIVPMDGKIEDNDIGTQSSHNEIPSSLQDTEDDSMYQKNQFETHGHSFEDDSTNTHHSEESSSSFLTEDGQASLESYEAENIHDAYEENVWHDSPQKFPRESPDQSSLEFSAMNSEEFKKEDNVNLGQDLLSDKEHPEEEELEEEFPNSEQEDTMGEYESSKQENSEQAEETIHSENLYFGNDQDETESINSYKEETPAYWVRNREPEYDGMKMSDSSVSEEVDSENNISSSIKKQLNTYQEKGKAFREKFSPKSSFIDTLKNVRYKIQKDDGPPDGQLDVEGLQNSSQQPEMYYVRWKDNTDIDDREEIPAQEFSQDTFNEGFEEGATQIFSTNDLHCHLNPDEEHSQPQHISREWLRKHREKQIKNYPKESLIDHMTKDASKIVPEHPHQDPIITEAALDEMVAFDHLKASSEESSSEEVVYNTHDDDTNFLSGAAWITFGMVFSRIIGALYVIPWATWFGEGWIKANGLYGAGYDPYVFFLALATAGIPSAIAKQISYNHSLGKYKTANILFKYSVYIMIASGIISGAALYFMAPFLAENTAIVDKEAATRVIQSLAPALLILPAMSIIRGYFQGHSQMKPIAISDVIEQFVRVIYLLAATYAVMKIINGNVTQAVIHSTFAAFVGAVASLVYLLVVFIKHRKGSQALVASDSEEPQIDFMSSAKLIIKDSIPFIILGSGIIIAKLINTYTFGHILKNTSILMLSEIEEMYGVLNLDVDKLIMIIVSLAIALSSSFLPALTRVYTRKDEVGTSTMITQIIIVFFFVMLPSSFGMAAISRNIYLLFYPNGSVLGPEILFTAAFSSIILGLFTVLSSILQSMSFRLASVKFLLVGLIFKLLLQYPLVAMFQAHGAIISTSLGLGLTCAFMWIKINREVKMDNHGIVNNLVRIIIPTILMGVSAMMWAKVLNGVLPHAGRLENLGIIVLVIIFAIVVYAGLMGIQGMLSIIIGDRFKNIQNKMRIIR